MSSPENYEMAGPSLQPEDLVRLGQTPLFSELPSHLIDVVLADAVVHRYTAGEMLFCQGATPEYLHVVLTGEVGLYGIAIDGGETVMEIMKSGEVFIAAAVLTDLPYLMEARALSPSRVLLLPAERLRKDLRALPDLVMAMLTSLSIHFRKMVREAKTLKLNTPIQRLGVFLLSLTIKREGSTILWLPHNKGIIAARIGVRQESLSRAFATLRQHGVRTKGSRVEVDDMAALVEFCHQDDEFV